MSKVKFRAKKQIGAKGGKGSDKVEVTLYFQKSLKKSLEFVSGALADAEAAEPAEESDLSDVQHILEVLYEAMGGDEALE
jgi:hypothetical protein